MIAEVEIVAADGDESGEKKGPRKFKVRAYNGGPLQVAMWDTPVVIDLAGLELGKSVVANLHHDSTQIVGHVTEHENNGKRLDLSGMVSGTGAAALEFLANSDNGFPWQASVETRASVVTEVAEGKKITVNGQKLTGPLQIATESKLHGIAFLPHGADENTHVKIAASSADPKPEKRSMNEELKKWIVAKGFDPDAISDEQVAFFKSAYDAEIKAAKTPKTTEQITLDDVLSKEKAKRERISQITQITANAITDYPGSIDSIKAIADLAIEGEWDKERFELEILRATRPQATAAIHSREDSKISNRIIEAAVCDTGKLPNVDKHYSDQELQAAHDRFPRGIKLGQLILIAARDNGFDDRYTNSVTLEAQRAAFRMNGQRDIRAGFSTVNLPNILSNTANKFLNQGFNAVDAAWRMIASTRSVSDFKQITSHSLTGDANFEKLGASGEIKHGTLGELQYTNQADTYARMYAITRTDIINDDLGALTAVPVRLGRGAGLKLNNIFWTEFLDNSTHFSAGNSNVSTGAGSALAADGSGVDAAEVVFMAQTDPDGEPLGLMPRILLVPPTLKNTALRLMNSSMLAGGSDPLEGSANIYEGRYMVVSSPYMENSNYTGNSTAAWYLLTDPAQLSTIEVVFLDGRDTPIVDTADADFNVLGIQMRGYMDAGVNKQEVRAGVRSAGS